jgi:two-component system cell cycle sensor histidine kinase/response regulator CckA
LSSEAAEARARKSLVVPGVSQAAKRMSQRAPFAQNLVDRPEQIAALLDCVRELVTIQASDGTIVFAGAGFSKILGYAPEELTGLTIDCLLHESDKAGHQQLLRENDEERRDGKRRRCRLRGRDGGWRWFEADARIPSRESLIEGTVVTYLDVTDLHRMEAERQVISEVVHGLNQTANLDELLSSIHQALKKVLYAENCFVALHDACSDSFQFPFFADEYDSAPAPQRVGRSCTAFVFRTGKARLIPQSEFDRLVEQNEVELVGSPSPSWLGVPLKTPTATIGVLVVQHYSNEHAYDERDLEFIDSVGGHIALAIERRRAEEALRQSESEFRLLFEHNPLPTWVFDSETLRFLQVNDAAVRQYGYTADEFDAMTILDIRLPEERAGFKEQMRTWLDSAQVQASWKHVRKDGRALNVEITSHQVEYAGRRVRLMVAQDVSERQSLEEQLRQAQKMEAVGRLAGGVAHDFNNLLMVIKGHTELLLNVLPPSDQISRKIEHIDRAADRATALTRQLLAFSRMQVLQPRAINLNTIVEDMGNLLPRLIGEDIELVIRPATALGTIRADGSQMEQVIMNLAVNARDAMPGGGKLVIETENADLDHSYSAGHPVVKPGRYVMLAVSDSGVGMDAATQAHIFEPFFTTKEQGKGTGLGLATVYGVVKQSGGFIWVYSEVGKGTCFKIYLPRVDQAAEAPGAVLPFAEVPRGTETVLLSEDEQDVREVAREFLESGGYTVIEAQNGTEALELGLKHNGKIDLLITDMVMPGMRGQELAARLSQQRSDLRVLYMSGYSEHSAADGALSDRRVRLLTKPFSRSVLLRTVRELLNDGVG